MPSSRKQKANEKRSRQSDVMSDIENMDVMLGNFPETDFQRQELTSEIEVDSESGRQHRDTNQVRTNFSSFLNTTSSVSSEITAELRRAINTVISSQMPKKLEEVRPEHAYT